MAVFGVVVCILSLLWLTRLSFIFLFLVPAFVCLTNQTSTETCGYVVFSQGNRNKINTAGTFVEVGSSSVLAFFIFRWEKFKVTTFLLAAPRLAVFWFWISLFFVQAASTINRDILAGKWPLLGSSLLLEYAALVLISLALKFIEKSTVKAWINRKVHGSQSARYMYILYILTLWMYLLRNLAVGSYHMAMFAKRTDLHADYKHIDNLLNLGAIAFRTAFVQFFYAAIFRKARMPQVCEELTSREKIYPIAIGIPDDRTQGSLPWDPFIK